MKKYFTQILGIALISITAIADEGTSLGLFKNTGYFLREESEFEGQAKDTDVLTPSGTVLARVNHDYKRLLNIEGSGLLMDGRVVTNAGTRGGIIRYVESSIHGYGITASGCAAIPFKTIAVDPRLIPLGTVVHIQETEGMPLPDGSHHNGNWVAMDTGSAIQGHRIDLYIGSRRLASTLNSFGIRDMMSMTLSIARPRDPNDLCQVRP